ncbi:MAG: hypothetical protein EBV75_06960 [Acidimicrobiia bacterium]|nr:hypothetical protein [Acidimicrobiia bacterium]
MVKTSLWCLLGPKSLVELGILRVRSCDSDYFFEHNISLSHFRYLSVSKAVENRVGKLDEAAVEALENLLGGFLYVSDV